MAIITDDRRLLKKRFDELDKRKDELVPDAVYGYQFRESTMRECPHPAVRKNYASAIGHCYVSPWTCRTKCRYAVTYRMHGGVSCGYEKEKKNGQDVIPQGK